MLYLLVRVINPVLVRRANASCAIRNSRCSVGAGRRRWDVGPDAPEPLLERDWVDPSASGAVKCTRSIEIVTSEGGGNVVVCALRSWDVSKCFREREFRLERCGIFVSVENKGSSCFRQRLYSALD